MASPPPQKPAAPFRLELDLDHRLADFSLRLAFTTSCRRLGILGASGAGKSQLLRCLAGLERPTHGRVVLNGRVLFDSAQGVDLPLRRRRIGLVVQHYALFPHLTVAENVGFGLAHLAPRERSRRVAQQLQRVGLSAMAQRYPSQLSGGQQQRIALARALAIEPELLLLDEPFAAQDAYLRRQLQQQLADLLLDCRVPALLVTHDLEEAYRLSDDLVVIDRGTIRAHGPKHEVFDQPSELVVARISGCKNFSRVRHLSPCRLWATDWQLELHLELPVAPDITHVGIRANHLLLAPIPCDGWDPVPGRWLCRLVKASEGPFQVSAYVTPIDSAGCAPMPLQVEVQRSSWQQLSDGPQPWVLTIPLDRLMLLRHPHRDQAPDQTNQPKPPTWPRQAWLQR